MLFSKEYPVDDFFGIFNAINPSRSLFGLTDQVFEREYPTVNLVEVKGEQSLVAELPGVKKEDVSIEVKGNILRIKGKRVRKTKSSDSLVREERRDFEFDRSFRVSYRIDSKKVAANLEDGILTVKLPQSESDKPKAIKVS
ncbi:MAG: Hsp20/alpha crystallin family protein [Proteobacteria bacterium]|nr:Hsp20/alpha crystallin family protein [Pseudomonadota bacterium]